MPLGILAHVDPDHGLLVIEEELVWRDAKVRYDDGSRPDYWARASASLALDRHLAATLEQEEDRGRVAVADRPPLAFPLSAVTPLSHRRLKAVGMPPVLD